MDLLVNRIIAHGHAVKEFRLRSADGAALPSWHAGAHIVLRLRCANGKRFRRHYCLVGAPGASAEYRIAVLREAEGQGGSRYLHDEVTVGSSLSVSGPFNSFPLSAKRATIILIGGGIGITPIVSIMHALSAQGRSFELHYLARSANRLILLDELSAIPGAAVTPHLSRTSSRANLGAILGQYTADAEVYACGPRALWQSIATAAARHAWPPHALHFESFGAERDADRPLTVALGQSHRTVMVPPDTSILDALLDAGACVAGKCRGGECGRCYTPVLSGQPLHRDECLTRAQRASGMCTCVSWAVSDELVLDL